MIGLNQVEKLLDLKKLKTLKRINGLIFGIWELHYSRFLQKRMISLNKCNS